MTADPKKVVELSTALNASLRAEPTRASRDDGYGRSSRFYTVGDKKYPSVTTILSVIAKPALINWAAKVEREMVTRAAADLYEDAPLTAKRMSRLAYLTTLSARIGKEKANTKLLTKAGELGTAVHKLIEWNMRRELQQLVGAEPKVPAAGTWAFMAYEDWRKQSNLSISLVEQVVYSQRYEYAGTMDFAGEIDVPGGEPGERITVLGDFKTGKGIYPEAELQVAAYSHCLTEMQIATPGTAAVIIRLPKVENDPGFEVRYIAPERMKHLFRVFLHVSEMWRWMDSV